MCTFNIKINQNWWYEKTSLPQCHLVHWQSKNLVMKNEYSHSHSHTGYLGVKFCFSTVSLTWDDEPRGDGREHKGISGHRDPKWWSAALWNTKICCWDNCPFNNILGVWQCFGCQSGCCTSKNKVTVCFKIIWRIAKTLVHNSCVLVSFVTFMLRLLPPLYGFSLLLLLLIKWFLFP